MKTNHVVARLDTRGEAIHYLANAFYMDDDYTVTNHALAHRFDTHDDAQRALDRVAARGICLLRLRIVENSPCP